MISGRRLLPPGNELLEAARTSRADGASELWAKGERWAALSALSLFSQRLILHGHDLQTCPSIHIFPLIFLHWTTYTIAVSGDSGVEAVPVNYSSLL